MNLSKEQFNSLRSVELSMLSEFIKVCDQLAIKYYLLEGTLLGAVRHQGFIPWDDDIDVGMPREDYEKFLREGQALLPSELFVQTIFTEKDYRANFAKLRNSNTTFLETSVRHCNINHGVYIDIFPLDFCHEDEREQKKAFLQDARLSRRINLGFYFPNRKLDLPHKIFYTLVKLRYPCIQKVLKKREKKMASVKKSSLYANYCSAWAKKEIMPTEWFGDGVFLQFEGIRARVPKEYHKWLTQVYGDYMQLPPKEKRVSHHYADVIDTEKPYLEYVKKQKN